MKSQSFTFKQSLFFMAVLSMVIFFPPCIAEENTNFLAAKNAFQQGHYSKAISILQSLLKNSPGNPDIDFLLGRSSFEAGDFETASFAFERVLISKPQAERAKLELARCYFEMGNLISARHHFKQVLAQNPPLAVEKNILRYLQLIDKADKKHSFNGMLSVGLSFDDNIHSSPVNQQIQTVIGNVTLSGSGSQAQEDLINQNSIRLSHRYRQHPKSMAWHSSALAHNSTYADEQNLNLNLFSVNSGPAWQYGPWHSQIQGQFNHLILNDKRFMTLYGFTAGQSFKFNKQIKLHLKAQFSNLDYASSDRDAEVYHLSLSQTARWGKNQLSLTAGLEFNQSRKDYYSYIRELLSIRYQRMLPWQLQGELAFRYYHSEYDDSEPLFENKRREDFREFRAGLSRSLWKSQNSQQQLRANLHYAYTENHSNLDLYRYDKQVANFTLNYLF